MKRYYCPDLESGHLSLEESRHCLQVIRQREGDYCALFDGAGREWKAQITRTENKVVFFKKLSETRTPAPSHKIVLAQALTKPKSMEFIIQKATELGATQISPLLSERSISRIDEERGEDRVEKWRLISIEAAKQCGQNWLPLISPILTPKQFLEQKFSKPIKLLASLQPEAKGLKQTLREQFLSQKVSEIIVMIGPEGDYSPAELGDARSAGFLPVSLGPIVLRAETAALFALSAINYEFSAL